MLAREHEEAEVLVFDLVPFAEALAQFEHSSDVVELMLVRCLRLCLGAESFVFGLPMAYVLPLNLAKVCPNSLVSLVAGGSYESLCDTLLQPPVLIGSWRAVAAQHTLVVVQHSMADVYYLFVAFARQRELLIL